MSFDNSVRRIELDETCLALLSKEDLIEIIERNWADCDGPLLYIDGGLTFGSELDENEVEKAWELPALTKEDFVPSWAR